MTLHTWNILNKEGKPVQISFELAHDLMIVHNLSATDIIENMYGTILNIEKSTSLDDAGYLRFTLSTNDERDGTVTWRRKE